MQFAYLNHSCIALFLATFTLTLFAQNQSYRKRFVTPFQENAIIPDSLTFDTQQYDAIIVYESIHWEIVQQWRTTICRVHRIVKPLNEQGLYKAARFVVPETLDPAAHYADLPLSKRDSIHRPKYFDMEINYVIARLIHSDGSTENTLPTKETFQQESIEFNAIPRNGYTYSFAYNKLALGDMIEYEYEYSLPYILDYARVFFHGTLPKQHFKFQIAYPAGEYYLFAYRNGAMPTDSVHNIKNNTLTWQYKQLMPAMDEPGSRPYLSLPHIEYYTHNKTFGTWEGEQITQFKPYTWSYVTHDWVAFKKNNLMQSRKKTSMQEIALNKFVKHQRQQLPQEHSPLQALLKIHNLIADSFTYKYETNAYANSDRRLAHLPTDISQRSLKLLNRHKIYNGIFDRIADDPALQLDVDAYIGIDGGRLNKVPTFLNRKILSNINSDDIYNGIFTRLGMPFYITQIEDKRYARIDPADARPLWVENRLYTVLANSNLFYVCPKRQRTGYYMNELPFYLENTVSLNIAQMTESFYDKNNVLFYVTPQSSAADNLRTLDAQININTSAKQLNTKEKLSLSGQFSTLMRGLYLYGTTDSSLLPLYAQPCYAQDALAKSTLNIELKNKNEQFPFKTDFLIQYSSKEDLLKTSNDSILYLTIGQWIKHISIDKFRASGRVQDYYPDFLHTDSYRYALSFDKPIKIADFKDLPLKISNDFADYWFDITQASPTQINIISQLHLKKEQTPAQKCTEVAQIYNAIELVKQQVLKVHIAKDDK